MSPGSGPKPAEKLLDGDAIGELACIIGVRHTVSAVATMETRVWVLRKRDFDTILRAGTGPAATRTHSLRIRVLPADKLVVPV